MDAPKKNEIKIEIPADVAPGKYSNFTVISHSPNEFIFDFLTMVPNLPKASVHTRLVMTPENAKNLLFALRDALTKYEAVFGEIERKVPKQAGNIPPFKS